MISNTIATAADFSPEDHPLVADVNADYDASLSPVERFCERISEWTGAPLALFLAIVLQLTWIVFGTITHWDPYPFAFLLTVSNVIQLILIFVLAVGQKRSSDHAERRAEEDHDSISRLLYHQEAQEEILLALAGKTETDVSHVRAMIDRLATEDEAAAA